MKRPLDLLTLPSVAGGTCENNLLHLAGSVHKDSPSTLYSPRDPNTAQNYLNTYHLRLQFLSCSCAYSYFSARCNLTRPSTMARAISKVNASHVNCCEIILCVPSSRDDFVHRLLLLHIYKASRHASISLPVSSAVALFRQ